MRLQLGLQSRPNRAKAVSIERAINLYSEVSPEEEQAPITLQGTPGLVQLVDTLAGLPCRGCHEMNETLFVIAGQSAYVVTDSGLAILLGSAGLIGGDGPVFMENNGTQVLVITSETRGFILTATSAVEITDPDFPTASSCAFVDGFFIITVPSSKRFYISDLNNGLAWDALQFASAEADPDFLVCVVGDHREAWLFGKHTTEVWQNTGAAPFPFERISGAFLTKGIAVAKSAVKLDNTIFWLGNDFKVYRADGYAPVRVSTHEEEFLIASCLNKAAITAYGYTQEGHDFYCLDLPGITQIVFDVATNLWHERQSDGLSGWLPADTCDAFGGSVAVSRVDGKVYEIDLNTFTDGGMVIRRQMITPALFSDGQRATISRLEIICEMGVGLATGQGNDPSCMMSYSNDKGHTFGFERRKSLGLIGEYKRRAQWWRLGQFRDRRFKFTISDPVQIRILELMGDPESGRV